ncbi:MAG: aromatic ring-hydroxylating dioxygenase subunit alpha [Actinomycetota bacterium]|nr:aromatic ring-hydroxylating dioxygenase subunit alpha [Actinomycetota bacterium]
MADGTSHDTRTLTRQDYLSDEVYELERQRIFHAGWMLAARADRLAAGNRTVVDLAGESVLLTRDLKGRLHAFANVCRHRGARLCDGRSDTAQGSLMCPYHAWTYALDGQLVATPHLDDEQVDKAALPLWAYHVREWQGFVFVSMAKDPPAFDAWMEVHCAELLSLARFQFGGLRVGAITTCDIAANWKIVVENYQECLHCTRVHPELVELVPLYRTGWVTDSERDDGGVALARGHSMASDAVDLPLLPGIGGADAADANSYYGGTIFPNGFIDVTGTCAIVSTLFPKGPHLTTMTMEFMFAPTTIEAPAFDPTPVVEFNELVATQDNLVCERVQQGVSSRAFEHGVLTEKDALVIAFTKHYLAARGPLG